MSNIIPILIALSFAFAACATPTPGLISSGGGGGVTHPQQTTPTAADAKDRQTPTPNASPVPAPAAKTAEPPQLGRVDLKNVLPLDKVYVVNTRAPREAIPFFKLNKDGSIIQDGFIRDGSPVLVVSFADNRLRVLLPWQPDPKDDPNWTKSTEGVVLATDVGYVVKPVKGLKVYPKEGGAGLFKSTTTFNDATKLNKVAQAGEPVVLMSDIKDAGLEVESGAYVFFGYTFLWKESVKLITLATPLPTKLPLSVKSSTLSNIQNKPNLLLVLVGASENDQFDIKVNGKAAGRYIAKKLNDGSVALEFTFPECGPEQGYSVVIQHAVTNEHYEYGVLLKVPCQ